MEILRQALLESQTQALQPVLEGQKRLETGQNVMVRTQGALNEAVARFIWGGKQLTIRNGEQLGVVAPCAATRPEGQLCPPYRALVLAASSATCKQNSGEG